MQGVAIGRGGAHVSHGPLLTSLLGALAAPASGFFPGPVESVVPVQVGPRAQAPLAARPVPAERGDARAQ